MIKINRGAAPPAIAVFADLTVRSSKGSPITRADSERARAIEFFTNPSNFRRGVKLSKRKFGFSIYKDAELDCALEAALGRKCVYCESRFAHVTPKDIEHFRPKSQIERHGKPTLVPGYFWLAGEWSNLLISCPDCNRARQHEVPGQTKTVRLGKQAQFPLRNERLRVRRHTGNVSNEEPARLLLNPCVDDPEKHLTFDDRGLIHAAQDGAGIESDMGAISIRVYALQRKTLVEERLRALDALKVALYDLRDLIIDLNTLTSTEPPDEVALARKREQIGRMRVHLETLTSKDAPYLAMIRGYIRRQTAEGEFGDFRAAGIDLEKLLD